MSLLLAAQEIAVRDRSGALLLEPLSLSVGAGVPLVILGETGSGKSLAAQAILGTLPPDLTASGEVTLAGQRSAAGDRAARRTLWGRFVAILPQEPWLALDPLMRAAPQVAEAHHLVRGLDRTAAGAAAAQALAELGLAGAGRHYPHQLSGGMAQRVTLAAAQAGGARLTVADEPTKGLDAARRDEVADLLLRGVRAGGGLLVITHDLALARRLGGHMMVLRAGRLVETGPTAEVLAAPATDYTRALVAADPETWSRRPGTAQSGPPVLATEGLGVGRGGRPLVSGLSLEVAAGAILGVTGPSGSGKSSLGDALLGLLAPVAGSIRRLPGLPRTAFQKLWQDPVAAFPLRFPLRQTLDDLVRLHWLDPRALPPLLDRLGLPESLLARRPTEISGGELQRLALLRLLLLRPAFLFADEPTSRLDPITQQQVIGILGDMARDGCAVLLVSHDPALVANTADAVVAIGARTTATGV